MVVVLEPLVLLSELRMETLLSLNYNVNLYINFFFLINKALYMTYSGCHAGPHLQSRATYTRRNLLCEQDVPVSRDSFEHRLRS